MSMPKLIRGYWVTVSDSDGYPKIIAIAKDLYPQEDIYELNQCVRLKREIWSNHRKIPKGSEGFIVKIENPNTRHEDVLLVQFFNVEFYKHAYPVKCMDVKILLA